MDSRHDAIRKMVFIQEQTTESLFLSMVLVFLTALKSSHLPAPVGKPILREQEPNLISYQSMELE